MLSRLGDFFKNDKDYPFLAALICGLLPMLFYYSNNYWAVNSWSHLLFFALCYIGPALLLVSLVYFGFNHFKKLKPYKSKAILILVLGAIFLFLNFTFFATTKRRLVLIALSLVLGFVLWKQPRVNYKKLLIVLVAFSSLSVAKIMIHIYEDLKPKRWVEQPDGIKDVQFKSHPNVYMIQPDGYVSQHTMEKPPYNNKSDLYHWLKENDFKIYDDFRSNYPASLTSNASLFAMKQHRFANMLLPEIEMADAREVITVKNPVVSIFQNNNYHTHFIAQDEYFQQNRKQVNFDYFNIDKSDFPFYTDGGQEIRNVFEDLKSKMHIKKNKSNFFFVEKLLPHHVGFGNTEESIREERDKYVSKTEEVNMWLKDVIAYISEQDKTSIIIILADHGGWVGLKSFNDLFSNEDPVLINSTFSNIAAIRWNGHLQKGFDKDLKSNVNVFRVLFSVLSEESQYLNHLEDDSSYNLKLNTIGLKRVQKMIDTDGNILY